MDRVEYQQALVASVVAPNNFSVSDEEYLEGNGRLARVRPPLPTEQPELVNSLQILGYTPFAIILRADMGSPSQVVAR